MPPPQTNSQQQQPMAHPNRPVSAYFANTNGTQPQQTQNAQHQQLHSQQQHLMNGKKYI